MLLNFIKLLFFISVAHKKKKKKTTKRKEKDLLRKKIKNIYNNKEKEVKILFFQFHFMYSVCRKS